MERLTEERIQQWFDAHAHPDGMGDCQFCDDPWPCYWHQANLLLQDTRDELATLRSQHAEVLGAVREAVDVLRGAASIWNDAYPAWLVYALLGDDADAAVPLSDIDVANNGAYHAIRALVALAEVQS